MERKENIIIIESSSVRKSMIATWIGLNVCRAGYKVLFANAKDLIDELYNRILVGNLAEMLGR